jgi:hypothetical protein
MLQRKLHIGHDSWDGRLAVILLLAKNV